MIEEREYRDNVVYYIVKQKSKKMKKKYLFSMAVAALMMGACQSEDIASVGNGPAGPEWTSDGKGYVSLAINLPTKPTMLRGANDSFDEGTVAEYYVQDAMLVLFTSTNPNETNPETNATFAAAYQLDLSDWDDAQSGQNVTRIGKIVQEISQLPSEGKSAYALVVLNNNGALSIENSNGLRIGNIALTVGTSKLADLNEAMQAVTGNNLHANSFLMSNAPLSTMGGGSTKPDGAKIQTLAKIELANIKDTEAEAVDNPAAEVYVERAVAKVTVTAENGHLEETGTEKEEGLAYTILGWTLDNTNPVSNLVRTYDGTWNNLASVYRSVSNPYRMIGGANVAPNLFRTYWGADANYDAAPAGTNLLVNNAGKIIENGSLTKADGAVPAYCLENTTDVAHMNDDELTRIIVKAEFNGGKDFYIVNGNKEEIYVDDGALTEANSIQKRCVEAFMKNPQVAEWIKSNLNDSKTADATSFTITLPAEPEAGMITKGIKVAISPAAMEDNVFKTGANLGELANIFATTSNFTVDYYKGGESYYQVYIKHFGDELTPWSKTVVGAENEVYPDENKDNNYLGRYGVLRNNWYDISVTAIHGIGSSTVPEFTGDPVDELEKYIAVKINILAWAKRSQEVVL